MNSGLVLSFFFLGYAVAISFFKSSNISSYAPQKAICPSGQLTRSSTTGLNSNEKSYIDSRYPIAKSNLATFLKDANLKNFSVDSFLNNANPTIGLAFSGGGYRAQLTGAGQYAALDSRNQVTKGKGLGGILQSASYIAGLSGGAWLVGSVVSNDLISIDDLESQSKLWQTQTSILDYYGVFDVLDNQGMWLNIGFDVQAKQFAGFDTSITDLWGRALSYQLLANYPNNGAGFTFSSVMDLPSYQSHQAPYPILVSLGREPGTSVINVNSTIFSMTPHELGSEDPSLQSFAQTKYLGSKLDNGYPVKNCYTGFDNAGFFMGTSSSLFNSIITTLSRSLVPKFIQDLITNFAVDAFEGLNTDVANYNPNPFYKSQNPSNSIEKSQSLHLVDGGEDDENIPLVPLVRKGLSVIFAFDASRDVAGYPAGSSLISTYQRQFSSQGNFAFPHVPDQKTFRNLNLTAKPCFFGCDAKNMSDLSSNPLEIPLVIYFANRPFSFWSNTSTWKLAYPTEDRNAMIQNGFETATRLNGTLDDEWNACVGCAIIRREQERLNIQQTEQCRKCFQKYCWDGSYYTGDSIGDNFDYNGMTENGDVFNAQSIPGFDDTGADVSVPNQSN
ncbi:uncharacterized protein LODBEIA_P41120 [Lodderomyces beijingensis]|uniref:Lysophospholipase n=1 Tax=Lodderomyces beijingensis TaxID=1775926 RepID=A0ABP0ZQC2_9ASCO